MSDHQLINELKNKINICITKRVFIKGNIPNIYYDVMGYPE